MGGLRRERRAQLVLGFAYAVLLQVGRGQAILTLGLVLGRERFHFLFQHRFAGGFLRLRCFFLWFCRWLRSGLVFHCSYVLRRLLCLCHRRLGGRLHRGYGWLLRRRGLSLRLFHPHIPRPFSLLVR